MIKVLIDTNIILDIGLRREDFFEDASKIFEKIDEQLIEGYITANSFTDIYYIVCKQKGDKKARSFLKDLYQVIDILGVDRDIILEALISEMKDFEDAIQSLTAWHNEIDLIITRNTKDFKRSKLKTMNPKDFLAYLVESE